MQIRATHLPATCGLALLLVAAPIGAQAGSHAADGPLPRVRAWLERQVQALELSAGQRQRLRAHWRLGRDGRVATADRLWAARAAVLEATFSDDVDEALIRQRVHEAAELAAELAVQHARLRAELRRELTPVQRQGVLRLRLRLRALAEGVRAGLRAWVLAA